jgi:hypothetical protein
VKWLWLVLLVGGCARPPACLLPGQTRMVAIEMFFGRGIVGRGPVTEAEWAGFAAREIAPRFPDGFTVLDGQGQWRDPRTGRVGGEASKVVLIDVAAGGDLAARVQAVALAYRLAFRQLAVGVASHDVCAAF